MRTLALIFGVMALVVQTDTALQSIVVLVHPDSTNQTGVPSFVGVDFYCESGFSGSNEENIIVLEYKYWRPSSRVCYYLCIRLWM